MTIGISPKVKLPAIALLILGVILLGLSFVVEGADDLAEVGLSLIGASGLVGGVGYKADPGPVETNVGTPEDADKEANFPTAFGPSIGEPDGPTPEDEPEPRSPS